MSAVLVQYVNILNLRWQVSTLMRVINQQVTIIFLGLSVCADGVLPSFLRAY